MKIVDLKCPNCSGSLTKEGDNLICSSCGAAFAIDYDDSDVEYEKLQTEAEREERRLEYEKELLEKEYELKRQAEIEAEKRQQKRERQKMMKTGVKKLISSIISLAFLAGIGFGMFKLYQYMMTLKNEGGGSSTSISSKQPTPAPNYKITPEDVAGQMDEFIKVGKEKQMKIDQCSDWNKKGSIKYYDKKSADFVDAYIVNDIPDTKESRSNRLVLIYKVKWQSGKTKKNCYDAVYFEGLKVNPNGGGVVSDFSAETIIRSDAAWGWGMAYSFEKYEQCYRENVTALGGNVTKIESGSANP